MPILLLKKPIEWRRVFFCAAGMLHGLMELLSLSPSLSLSLSDFCWPERAVLMTFIVSNSHDETAWLSRTSFFRRLRQSGAYNSLLGR
jgi:hypothetical protein